MVLVIQNDPTVPAGLLAEAFRRRGVGWATARAFTGEALPSVRRSSAVVVLGGTMGAWQTDEFPFLNGVRALVAEALAAQVPLLGICLGGQLLAEVAGGTVRARCCGEREVCRLRLTGPGRDDPLFRGVPEAFAAFEWHDDSFVPPAGSDVLASSHTCAEQAFRVGASAWGLQFHPEVDETIVGAWAGLEDADACIRRFQHKAAECRSLADRLFENFLGLAVPGVRAG